MLLGELDFALPTREDPCKTLCLDQFFTQPILPSFALCIVPLSIVLCTYSLRLVSLTTRTLPIKENFITRYLLPIDHQPLFLQFVRRFLCYVMLIGETD